MKIQFISYKNEIRFDSKHSITYNKLSSPKALDEFYINVFSLQDKNMWLTDEDYRTSLNNSNDFFSIRQMLEYSENAKNVILLPQNYTHQYYKLHTGYGHNYELKDDINNLQQYILGSILPNISYYEYSLIYENSTTKLGNESFESSFVFTKSPNILSKANSTEKTTSFNTDNIYLSTLYLENDNINIDEFIKGLGLEKEKNLIPEWINDYSYFDDKKQNSIIETSEREIDELNEKIKQSNEKLNENLKYKSILYTNGEELVKVVFEILEQILDFDLSDFVDEKKEDFLVEKEKITFIGEIKGVTSNVKSEHVSQLDVHLQSYKDDLDEDGTKENIKSLLIINPFRTKPLNERDEVHEIQINLAKRNESLIITTDVLLKLFEKFKDEKISSEQIVSLFEKNIGILTTNDFIKNNKKVDNSQYMI